jgi:hypothetical protein
MEWPLDGGNEWRRRMGRESIEGVNAKVTPPAGLWSYKVPCKFFLTTKRMYIFASPKFE